MNQHTHVAKTFTALDRIKAAGIKLPDGWDTDMGSSAKDLWIDHAIRRIEKANADLPGIILAILADGKSHTVTDIANEANEELRANRGINVFLADVLDAIDRLADAQQVTRHGASGKPTTVKLVPNDVPVGALLIAPDGTAYRARAPYEGIDGTIIQEFSVMEVAGYHTVKRDEDLPAGTRIVWQPQEPVQLPIDHGDQPRVLLALQLLDDLTQTAYDAGDHNASAQLAQAFHTVERFRAVPGA